MLDPGRIAFVLTGGVDTHLPGWHSQKSASAGWVGAGAGADCTRRRLRVHEGWKGARALAWPALADACECGLGGCWSQGGPHSPTSASAGWAGSLAEPAFAHSAFFYGLLAN